MTIAAATTSSIDGSPEDNETKPLLLDVHSITLREKQVEIYRSSNIDAQASWQEPFVLEFPTEIDCSEVMPDFILSMSRIF